LTALQLASRITDAFGTRPDFAFLTSEACTVRELLCKIQNNSSALGNEDEVGCVLKLTPAKRSTELPLLLIFGAAGTSVATYQPLAEHLQNMQVYCIEMPGRGTRSNEPLQNDFSSLLADIMPDVRQCAQNAKRLILWGDSLGAVLAYEVAKMLQGELAGARLQSLIVSGNAGPTVAALEQGMGNNTTHSLGRECLSVMDMSFDDWKNFFIASSGKEKAEELKTLLANEELAEQALRPLIADCEAYESYNHCDGTCIECDIVTIRGEQDCITSNSVMKSWEDVAANRVEHIQVAGSGHMLVRDAPTEIAKHIRSIASDLQQTKWMQ
jgi:surfactin synthase thioesterase subunit